MAPITHLTYRPDLNQFEVRRAGDLVDDRQQYKLADDNGPAPADVQEYLALALITFLGRTSKGSMTPVKPT